MLTTVVQTRLQPLCKNAYNRGANMPTTVVQNTPTTVAQTRAQPYLCDVDGTAEVGERLDLVQAVARLVPVGGRQVAARVQGCLVGVAGARGDEGAIDEGGVAEPGEALFGGRGGRLRDRARSTVGERQRV